MTTLTPDATNAATVTPAETYNTIITSPDPQCSPVTRQ